MGERTNADSEKECQEKDNENKFLEKDSEKGLQNNFENKFPEKLTNGFYRVKWRWKDEKAIAQYRILAKAKETADKNPGSFVFSNDGEIVYPVEAEKTKTAAAECAEDGLTEPQNLPHKNKPVAYCKLKTLMNIRSAPSLISDVVTIYKKNTIVEILEICRDDWYRIICAESETGFAYVNNKDDQYAYFGTALYQVKAGDTLRSIAGKILGDTNRLNEIMAVNGLTSTRVKAGMILLIP